MKKIILITAIFINFSYSFSQSKKEQIVTLQNTLDSFQFELNNVLLIKNNLTLYSDSITKILLEKQSITKAIKDTNNNFETEFKHSRNKIDSLILVKELKEKELKDFQNELALAIKKKNEENEIVIGTQTWMKKNLNVSSFRNGDLIEEAKSIIEWEKKCKEGKPAWCFYKFNELNGKKYGKLYNWYAVNDPRGISPAGWKIPSKIDVKTLESTIQEVNYSSEIKEFEYNSQETIGFKLKSRTGWEKFKGQDGNGNDKFNFNTLPGGYYAGGYIGFTGLGEEVYFWINDLEEFNYHIGNGWYGSDISGFINESATFCCLEDFAFYIRCIKSN